MEKRYTHSQKRISLLLLFLFSVILAFPQSVSDITPENKQSINFRENIGQWGDQILFRGMTNSAAFAFLNNELSFNFYRSANSSANQMGEMESQEILVWNLEFVGASKTAKLVADQKELSNTNYINAYTGPNGVTPNDYRMLTFDDLYENIDLVYYGAEGRQLKYDFILQPGADVKDIQLRAKGIEGLGISRGGELEIETPWGILLEDAPYSYQFVNGIKKEVDVRFELLSDKTFGFKIHGHYDSNLPLIIDPITLKWSTYVGGTTEPSTGYALDLFVDGDGYTYLVGWYGQDFYTTPGVYDMSYNDSTTQVASSEFSAQSDIYIAKLTPDGSNVVFTTYLGGKDDELGKGIVVDDNGDIYITGCTESTNYPVTTNAFQKQHNGGKLDYARNYVFIPGDEVVVSKLSADGTSLIYSTYVGGNSFEAPGRGAIDINSKGEVVVNGFTMSQNFPTTTGSFRPTYQGGRSDGFVFKLNADGSDVIFSSFYGGSATDNYSTAIALSPKKLMYYVTNGMNYFYKAGGVALDAQENIYITGWTSSPDFYTTAGAYQTVHKGPVPAVGESATDAFVLKLNATGSAAIYSTFIGGSNYDGHDAGIDIAVDDQNRAYVVGTTTSMDFPVTAGATDQENYSQSKTNIGEDGFLLRLNAAGSGLDYSTFIGGRGWIDLATGVDVNSNYEAYVTGISKYSRPLCDIGCQGLTITACAMKTTQDPTPRKSDIFIVKADEQGKYLYSTLFGGEHYEYQPKIFVSESEFCMEQVTVSYATHSKPINDPIYGQRPSEDINSPKGELPITDGAYQNICWQCGTSSDIPAVMRISPEIEGEFTNTTPECGNAVQFNASAQGTCIWSNTPWTPSNWHWDFGDGNTADVQNPSHTFSSAGTYEVTLTVGCPSDTVKRTVVVTSDIENVDLGEDIEKCGDINETLTVGDQSSPIHWSTGATTSSITVTSPGTYSVTVGSGACVAKDEVIITQLDNLSPLATKLSDATCSDPGSAEAYPNDGGQSGPYVYNWSDGQTTREAVGLNPGEYTVEVTNAAGCKGTASVTIIGSGALELTIPPVTINGCDRMGAVNGSATAEVVVGTAPFTYQWDDARQQTTQTATGLPAGIYTVTVKDSNGCQTSGSVEVKEMIEIDIQVDVEPCNTCSDGELTAVISGTGTPPYTVRWNDPGQQTTKTATGLKPGKYVITVTDDEGCRNSDTIKLGNITSIYDPEWMESRISIYPNPSSGSFNVTLDLEQEMQLQLFNLTGSLIHEQKLIPGRNVVNYPNISEGVYLLQLSNDKTRYSKRLYFKM